MHRIVSAVTIVACLALTPASHAATDAPVVVFEASGQGQAVIFLPGIGAPGAIWDETVAALSPRYLCIRASIAGFGGLPPAGSPGFDALTRALIGHIEGQGWKTPVLVAHSFGGVLALSLAAARPGLFSRVIIVDAYPFPLGQLQPGLAADAARQHAAAARAAMGRLSDADFQRQQAAAIGMSITDEARARTPLRWMMASDRETVMAAQAEMLAADMRPRLASIQAPTLVIGTWRGREPFGFTRDKVLGLLEEQYRLLPRHEVVVTDTARHYVMVDEPRWLADQIVRFIGR